MSTGIEPRGPRADNCTEFDGGLAEFFECAQTGECQRTGYQKRLESGQLPDHGGPDDEREQGKHKGGINTVPQGKLDLLMCTDRCGGGVGHEVSQEEWKDAQNQ